jgi:WD40 repeat protein
MTGGRTGPGAPAAFVRRGVPDATLAFSPDGTRIATVNHLWDLKARKVLATFPDTGVKTPYSWVNGVKTPYFWITPSRPALFSPDGVTLATRVGRPLYSRGTDMGRANVQLWNARTGAPGAVLRHQGEVWDLFFSPDGQRLTAASGDGQIRVWEVTRGRPVAAVPLRGGRVPAPSCAAFSPDGRFLAAGGQDRVVRLWDVRSGRAKSTLRGHGKGVLALAFSPDSTLLASAGWDSTLRLWSTRTGQALGVGKERSWIDAVVFSPDGQWIATHSRGGKFTWVDLWKAEEGARPVAAAWRPVWHKSDLDFYGSLLVFSPDGKTLVTKEDSGDISVDLEYALRDTQTREVKIKTQSRTRRTHAIAFSPDGETLAIRYPGGLQFFPDQEKPQRTRLELWDAKTGKLRDSLPDD